NTALALIRPRHSSTRPATQSMAERLTIDTPADTMQCSALPFYRMPDQARPPRDMRSLVARILLIAVATVMAVHAAEPVILPKVSFDNLSKDRVTLPADFHGDRNLLLL